MNITLKENTEKKRYRTIIHRKTGHRHANGIKGKRL